MILTGTEEDEPEISLYPNFKKESITPTGPVAMAAVGKTLIFPRIDNIYKKKESLPFDEVNSLVWQDRPRQRKRE